MSLERNRSRAVRVLSCLALASSAPPAANAASDFVIAQSAAATAAAVEAVIRDSSEHAQRLAVVVPTHRGDLPLAVSSLGRWPTECSSITEDNVDLVLYYAEGEEDVQASAALPAIAASAGRCFANTRLVYANLNEDEDVYPKGPSVQFYKMFLDEDVHAQLEEYDALAIIEWDVLVASDRSFSELYRAAFGSTEEFWVKGSNLEGTNFHSEAAATGMWHVLGHINGNAIYNNNDPAFLEYVDYTLLRWGYDYPYDVALWATIADFPYSWPLWQRFSSKFVTTNLISNVGYEHVDSQSVSDAVAGKTLFIHGSSVDSGNVASVKATTPAATGRRALRARREDERGNLLCEAACGSTPADFPAGVSTACDATCAVDVGDGGRFGGYLCGAGNSAKFGAMCRVCYTDVHQARKAESLLGNGRHVVMCDTMRPPPASECSAKCGLKKDTVCDETCGTGVHGDYNCNWRDLGDKCRFCFDDTEVALLADEVAKRHGGRAIMCDTHEPPVTAKAAPPSRPQVMPARRLQPWKETQKWRKQEKWTTEEKWKNEEKWKSDEKWKTSKCLDGCKRTSNDKRKGRVCDYSCKNGTPYGTLGCGAKKGQYGPYCRVCYNDRELALKADTRTDRAIMCPTLEPVTTYSSRMLLSNNAEDASGHVRDSRKLQKWKKNKKWEGQEKWKRTSKWKGGGSGDSEDEPKWKKNHKWQAQEKWKTNNCDDGCYHLSHNGKKGRVCDTSCRDGVPYGNLGCNAKSGMYGRFCRACYHDEQLALKADSADNRAIMCDTVKPVTVYRRSLRSIEASPVIAPEDGLEDLEDIMAQYALTPFTDRLTRGDLCTFVEGGAHQVGQVEVAVQSILEFMPGVRVAVTVAPDTLEAYESAVGIYPTVSVSPTRFAHGTSSLFADRFCGAGTKLVYYIQAGSVLSRTFTAKDTHSPRGKLLVVHGDARSSNADSESALRTASVLGFQAPSFTYGTDLILPVGANVDLREELQQGAHLQEWEEDEADWSVLDDDMISVPQLMAALAYARNSQDMWFIDPQTWVTQHLFKTASIWDVPLVKPRFACSIQRSALVSGRDEDNAAAMSQSLDFFRKGGSCENGLIAVDAAMLPSAASAPPFE